MKNLNRFLLGIISFFLMTSCEKENASVTDNTPSVDQPEELVTFDRRARNNNWTRIFTDEFNGRSVNTSVWERTNRDDYNSRNRCFYVENNPTIAVLDGNRCLRLNAYSIGNGQYNSGHVKSFQDFTPGNNQQLKFSARIKLIARQGNGYRGFSETYGAWPAFWTVNETTWPTRGEIDIMEGYSFGNRAEYASNLFYGFNEFTPLLGSDAVRDFDGLGEGWHEYVMYWTNVNGNVYVDVFVDGRQEANYFNGINRNLRLENFVNHNIIFNLNVGSNDNLGIFNNNLINLFSETQMFVDWVRVDRKNI